MFWGIHKVSLNSSVKQNYFTVSVGRFISQYVSRVNKVCKAHVFPEAVVFKHVIVLELGSNEIFHWSKIE